MALQFLYLVDVAKLTPDQIKKALFDNGTLPEKVQSFAERLALGTLAEIPQLDVFISKYTENWEINRMTAVDRNILRLASFEILKEPETPISVIIDEAVEIAKTYSTADSGKFVNGILDKIKLERKENRPLLPSGGEGKDEGD